jgi:alanine dehydrogenase
VDPAKVVILGGGVVGSHACHIALGMGAEVWVLDRSVDVLRALWRQFGRPLNTGVLDARRDRESRDERGPRHRRRADPRRVGAEARDRGAREKDEAGSVIVDVAIDQGGCFETSRPTTHADPVYVVDGVTHYCVANMPGGVPRTSTFALNNATLPFVLALAARAGSRRSPTTRTCATASTSRSAK